MRDRQQEHTEGLFYKIREGNETFPGYKAVLFLLLCPYFMKESMTQKRVDVILEKGEEGYKCFVTVDIWSCAVWLGDFL